MTDRARRKALREQAAQTRPQAGVYRIVNRDNGNYLLGASNNLAAEQNKLAFARKANSAGALDHRLRHDFQQFGPDAFDFETLEVLEVKPEQTPMQIADDLATLEELWREKLDPASLF